MSEPRDTSSISFTALYTGHVWTRDGISAPFFRTRGGAFLYGALAPFELQVGAAAESEGASDRIDLEALLVE